MAKKKAASSAAKPMNLSDFYNEVARRTDTDKTDINVADTKRVLAMAFAVLAEMDASDATGLIGKGLATAKRKASK